MTDLHFTRFLADLLLKIGLGTLIISQCDYHVRSKNMNMSKNVCFSK